MLLGTLVALAIVLGALALLFHSAKAYGQTLPPPVLRLPSVEPTGPQAKEASLGVMFTGEVLPAAQVDAVVRQQSLAYLESVAANMRPKPPTMVVGTITGKAFNPGCSALVYLHGWVVESGTRVQLRIDSSTLYEEAKVLATMKGYPNTWTWCVPEMYQDGKEHSVYARALRATGTYIGPLDNAKSTAKWKFIIPASPSYTNATVNYAAGVVTIEAAPRFAKVELLIDSRDISPWYQGVKPFVNGKATFALPAAAKDGLDHLLDVRLYDDAVAGVHRPDKYPVRAVLAP
jgi:hypothetical protein